MIIYISLPLFYKVNKITYLSGGGSFWFEDGSIGNDKSFLYILYGVFLFFLYTFFTFMEVLAAIWGELPKDEKNESVTLGLTHIITMAKMFIVLANRDRIKEINRKLVEICKEHEDEDRVANNYKVMKMNVAAYLCNVSGSVTCYVIEGIRKKVTGSHFITAVTYWPYYEDESITAVSTRIFNTILLATMMVTMIAIDVMVLITLIMYKYKVITLSRYIEGLRERFDKNNYKGNEGYAADQLYKGLLEGIVMHGKLLRLSKDIDRAYGPVLALQVMLGTAAAVSLSLQLVFAEDLGFAGRVKIILFLCAVLVLLGVFLCNAGEITYQAALLSDSLFYCGWHAASMRKDLRQLVLVACAYAQRPVIMKAFKMLELTYGTFLQVLRFSYSIFALFYAQNK